MICRYALLADSANQTKEGKLNVFGVFDRIWAKKFPVQHRQMVLILGLEGVFNDVGEHSISINLVDSVGDDAVPALTGSFNMSPRGPNKPPRDRIVLPIVNMPFEGPDEYKFEVRIDDVLMAEVPLEVIQHADQ